MSDTTQVHEIYFMSDDENKKMVMLEDYLESLSDIHKLKKRIVELEQDRNELSATVERLRGQLSDMANQHKCGCGHPACKRCLDDADNQEVLAATPPKNLNAAKREAIIDALNYSDGRYIETHSDYLDMVVEYANTNYPSDKE